MTNVFDRIAAQSADAVPREGEPPIDSRPLAAASAAGSDGVPRISTEIKSAVQELLKSGQIEEADRQPLFRTAVIHREVINSALEPLDLTLRIDTHRGVAVLVVAQDTSPYQNDDEGWSHPLVRKQRLTLEQSLLVAILRQFFVVHEQESGVGQSPATVAVEDVLPHFLTYFGDTGSDAKNENRLLQLLDQLKSYGIVTEVDKRHEVIIRPLIAHLASPESLSALLQVLMSQSGNPSAAGSDE